MVNFDIYTDYSDDINNNVWQNRGFYIYKEIITPDVLKYNNAFHFDHWAIYGGNCNMNDYNIYAPQVVVGNSRSNIIAFYANHDDISEGEVLPTYTTEGREHGECSTCGYSFYDNVIPKKVLDKPVVKATCGTNTIKLTWKAVEDAQKYVVYKYNAKTKKYSALRTVTANSVKLTKQPKGTNYYLVRAYNVRNAGSAFTTKNLVKAVVRK